MSSSGTTRRSVAGRLALVLPLCGGVLVAAAPSASAAINNPGHGTTYTSATTVSINASVPSSSTQSTLALVSPTGAERVLGRTTRSNSFSSYSTSLSGSLDTDCGTADCGPGQVRPAHNGTWTVVLSGAQSDRKSFVLRIPPRTPYGVSAETTAFREITVRWQRGVEPDLKGFTLYDGSGVVRSGIGLGSCSGTSCATTVSYPEDEAGQKTFRLRAHRATAPGSGDTVDSGDSGSASTTLAEKPKPAPEPTPDPGGSTGGSTSGSTGGETGGSTGGSTGGETGGSTGGSSGSTSGGDGGTTGDGGSTSGSTGSGSTGGSTGSGSTGGSTGSGSDGGSSSGSTGGSTGKPPIGTGSNTDNRVLDQRRAFALTFRAFAPKLGLPKLPPLPRVQAPVVGELEDGSFEETLGYGDKEVEEKYAILSSKRIGGAVSGALDSEQLMRFLATALVLLLGAAHLRRWLGATATELD